MSNVYVTLNSSKYIFRLVVHLKHRVCVNLFHKNAKFKNKIKLYLRFWTVMEFLFSNLIIGCDKERYTLHTLYLTLNDITFYIVSKTL